MFTAKEISDLKQLIRMRVNADRDDQKKIRRIMRSIGFYGSDYGIVDCQVSDLEGLIRSGMIKVIGGKPVSASASSEPTCPAVTPKATKTLAAAQKIEKGIAAAEICTVSSAGACQNAEFGHRCSPIRTVVDLKYGYPERDSR